MSTLEGLQQLFVAREGRLLGQLLEAMRDARGTQVRRVGELTPLCRLNKWAVLTSMLPEFIVCKHMHGHPRTLLRNPLRPRCLRCG